MILKRTLSLAFQYPSSMYFLNWVWIILIFCGFLEHLQHSAQCPCWLQLVLYLVPMVAFPHCLLNTIEGFSKMIYFYVVCSLDQSQSNFQNSNIAHSFKIAQRLHSLLDAPEWLWTCINILAYLRKSNRTSLWYCII